MLRNGVLILDEGTRRCRARSRCAISIGERDTECFRRRGLLTFCFGTRYCFVVYFYFALSVAFGALSGVARGLATIPTFISRGLSNQNVNQRGMDRILTSFRSVTFRAYHRRHMNSSLRSQIGVGLMNTIAKMVDKVFDRTERTCQETPGFGGGSGFGPEPVLRNCCAAYGRGGSAYFRSRVVTLGWRRKRERASPRFWMKASEL